MSDRTEILVDIANERIAQVLKWGDQHHPDIVAISAEDDRAFFGSMADSYKTRNDAAVVDGEIDWTDILLEEVLEALAESDPVRLREELIQSAAVIVAWIEDIDGRQR